MNKDVFVCDYIMFVALLLKVLTWCYNTSEFRHQNESFQIHLSGKTY